MLSMWLLTGKFLGVSPETVPPTVFIFFSFALLTEWIRPNVKAESMESTHNEKDASSLVYADSKQGLPLYFAPVNSSTGGRRIRIDRFPIFVCIFFVLFLAFSIYRYW